MLKLLSLVFIITSTFFPAYACLNDSEIQAYEEEFQSEYMQGAHDNNSGNEEQAPDGIASADDSSVIALASTGLSIIGLLIILLLAMKMDLRAFIHNKKQFT